MTCKLLPLERDERASVQRLKDATKAEIRPKAEAAKGEFVERKATEIAKADGRDAPTDDDRGAARRAVRGDVLAGAYLLSIPAEDDEFARVPVSEVLKNSEFYHGMAVPDPLEPDYDGGRLVGKLYLLQSTPCIHSFARGGKTYILSRGVEWIEHKPGTSAETAVAVAEALNLHPHICAYGGRIACIRDGKVEVLDKAGLMYLLGSCLQFYRDKPQPNGGTVRMQLDPPKAVIDMMNVPDVVNRLRPVDAVITVPTMRLDGSLLEAPGYDPATRLMLDVSGDEVMDVPGRPTVEAALAALDRVLFPVKDFPYVSPMARAVMLAALFTAVVRSVLPTAPAFGLDSSIQASGKTLSATIIGILASGATPLVVPHTHGRDDEEVRKRLTAILARAEPCVVWDNVVGVFDSPSMAAMQTSSEYSDRLLGCSETMTFSNRTLFLVTGNNLTPAGDLTRRVLVCRIDPGTDRPYARQFDLDPAAYVRQHRQVIVRDILTIMRAYRVAAPAPAPGKIASFEDWDAMVRQPIAWLASMRDDLADPMDAVDARQVLDPEQERLAALLDAIARLCGLRAFETKDLANAYRRGRGYGDLLDDDDVMACAERDLAEVLDDFNPRGGQASARTIGRILANRVDRIVDGGCLRRVGSGRVARWKVERVGGEA